MHAKCLSHWLDAFIGPHEWLPRSRFSVFAATSQLVAKIRRAQTAVSDIDSHWAIELARAELVRGRCFAPSIYLSCEPIACRVQQHAHCNAAVLMRRLPYCTRLDRLFANSDRDAKTDLIEKVLQCHRLVAGSLQPSPATTHSSLQSSDERLITVARARLGTQADAILQLWEHILAAREGVLAEIRARDTTDRSKQTHGDLSPGNIYIEQGTVYFLDPCVAFRDLFELDCANDWAHIGVTLACMQTIFTPETIIARCAHESQTSHHLMAYYFSRVALIRLTMRQLDQAGTDEQVGDLQTLVRIAVPS